MLAKINKITQDIFADLKDLNEFVYNNPELGYEEFKSSKAHIDLLHKYGFDVEENYMDMKTAFLGSYKAEKEGPTVAFLSEYDALPGIGHGCGHNLLGATNTGAAIVLKQLIDEIGGRVLIFGTPAEETSGAKVVMADKGAFDKVDFAICTHPSVTYYKSGTSLVLEALQFSFHGQTAHAAAEPEKGINALDAVIMTFNAINALREHVLPSSRIHGIITDGGKAANIVPDYAEARYYVRSATKTYHDELREKVINCAKGAALQTGASLEISNYEATYLNLITNETMSAVFTNNLLIQGVVNPDREKEGLGSLDMGNVSQVCPVINPYAGMGGDENVAAHTVEFRDMTVTDEAYKNMVITINAMVKTAADIILDKDLLQKIRDEFKNTKN